MAKSGMTPLEYLLSVMVDENLTRSERTDAAKAAAPYIHPRLSQVKHQGDEKAPIPIVFSKAEEGLL